jgi:hypothetical protein
MSRGGRKLSLLIARLDDLRVVVGGGHGGMFGDGVAIVAALGARFKHNRVARIG